MLDKKYFLKFKFAKFDGFITFCKKITILKMPISMITSSLK